MIFVKNVLIILKCVVYCDILQGVGGVKSGFNKIGGYMKIGLHNLLIK